MTCIDAADIEELVQDIPVQPPVVVPVRTVQEAVAAGDLSPLDTDAANVFSRSERILQDHSRRHFGFKLSTDPNGDRVFGGDANGSLTFELAQIRVGPGTVPISIVLYIDATYIKNKFKTSISLYTDIEDFSISINDPSISVYYIEALCCDFEFCVL
jgi:hypothetical protein